MLKNIFSDPIIVGNYVTDFSYKSIIGKMTWGEEIEMISSWNSMIAVKVTKIQYLNKIKKELQSVSKFISCSLYA